MKIILWENIIRLIITFILEIFIYHLVTFRDTDFNVPSLLLGIVYLTGFIYICTLIPVQASTYNRTDISVNKTDTQYLVKFDGYLLENVPTKEIVENNGHDYYLEITNKHNLFGKVTNSEYVLYIPTTITNLK